MTSVQPGGADRFSRAAERPHRASAVAPALVILLLLGLVLRLTIAYVLWPASGFESDIATYTAWANRLYELGPGRFYEPGVFADYPPAYLYVLWIGSHVTAFLNGGDLVGVPSDLLKLGPILADIGVAAALYAICRRWAGERADAQRLGLIAAGLYLFNPVTWYDSALWGQTDAVGALVILLCVAALVRGNSEGAAVLAVLAALVKPQFGIVVAPIVAAVLLRRHLLAPGSGPRNRPWAPTAGVRGWLSREQGLIRLVSSAALGLATLLLLITPFNLSVIDYLGRMAGTAGGYPWLSVNAYNPWVLLGSAGEQPLFLGFARWSSDTVPFLGPLPAVAIGAALLVGGFLVGMLRVGWRDDRRSIVLVAIFLALAFFVLPTRVHERYLFPVFALLPLWAVLDRRWLLALIALSVGALINFHGILTAPLYATPNIENLALGDLFRQPLPILLSVVLVSATFLWVLFQLRPAAAREPDPYEALDEITWPDGEGYEPSPPIRRRPGILGPIRETLAPLVAVVPVRRDRSAGLATERGGRFDRLDLLLLVVVLLATLGLRTFRLEKPYGMHFDEVYHARTATEFLQHWRYGMPHPIYEYTHPHLAKYVMALGIIGLGNNRVVAETELGGPVEGAATERRWSPDDSPGRRNGDRLYLATGSDVRVLDLADRLEEATVPVAADLVAVDDEGHVLFMADSAGGLWRLPTDQLDTLRVDLSVPASLTPEPLPSLDGLAGELTWLGVDGNRLTAIDSGGTVLSVDAETGEPLGRTVVVGAAEAQAVSGGERVMVDVAAVTEPSALADRLAEILDEDSADLASLISARDDGRLALGGYIGEEEAEELQAAIDADELSGVTIESGSAVAVAGTDGVTFLDADTLDELAFLGTAAPATGLALVERGVDQPTIYAAAGSVLQTIRLPEDGAPELGPEVVMPNEVRDAVWNRTTALLHVLGTRQDGSGPTVYVVAPVGNANSIFADAPLAFEPSQLLLDVQPQRPADDRADLLALAPSGSMATVDAGSNAFAWRFPGVVAGALMAACLYLLARFLFSRRSVAVIAALLVLADGMFFANARIAMNDTYVGLFIVAAFTLFVPLWLGRWRSRWATPAVLLGVGLLLGLALASKWVGAYAIGAIGLLILVRSALGRLLALAAMVGLTGLLGYLAMTPSPEVTSPQLNSLFLLLMVGLTVALAVMIALRPIRLTTDELRLAVIGPLAGGGLLLLAGVALMMSNPGAPAADGLVTPTRLLLAGAALAGLGALVYVAARVGGRFGRGPLALPAATAGGAEPAAPPPPRGWLRPGSGLLGLPWLLALALITIIPLGVYALSFVPWIELGNRWTSNFPAGNSGQLFLDLQVSMYEYHNNLRATHAASSPWWAWPLDLKPVWFYREEFAHNTTAQIYDAGNLPLFWLSLPAMAFAAYQAWRRRSLPLTVIVVAVACLWLPWARIDRVAFQYHIFTSLPFWVLGLAYLLAELWHGPSARTWLLARLAAAAAIIGPAVLWLLRVPLCGLARTEQVNPGTEVCGALSRNLVLTDMQVVGLLAAVGALLLVGWLLWQGRRGAGSTGRSSLVLPLVFGLVLVGGALALIGAALPGRPVFEHSVRAEEPALVMLFLLALPAYLVLRARDARRFVVGALIAIGTWFVVWYPNIAALPVPRTLAEIYQGLLPTWNYAFQFGSNQDAPNRSPMDLTSIGLLTLLTAVIAVGAMYAARAWRADRAADDGSLSVVREPG